MSMSRSVAVSLMDRFGNFPEMHPYRIMHLPQLTQPECACGAIGHFGERVGGQPGSGHSCDQGDEHDHPCPDPGRASFGQTTFAIVWVA